MNTRNTIMKTRKSTSRSQTTTKYFIFLNNLKKELGKKKGISFSEFTIQHNVSNVWVTYLKKNNIIIEDKDGSFKWNRNVAIDDDLIQSFRSYIKQLNYGIVAEKKIKKKSVNALDVTKSKLHNQYQEKKVGLIRRFLKWIY